MTDREWFLDDKVQLFCGDSAELLKGMPDNSVDSVVTDPPYALVSIQKRFGKAGAASVIVPEDGSGAYARASAGFMGKQWDTGATAHAVEFWAEVLSVLKPGGHLVAFAGTRTYHRLAVAIEDAGFEIRDMISWTYGSGFPKSHDVAKGLRRDLAGPSLVEEWDGWGTALKPAVEPICLARKPLSEKSVAANVLRWGTGAINIDGCRVASEAREAKAGGMGRKANPIYGVFAGVENVSGLTDIGRWPANLVHDGSDEVVALFPDSDGQNGTVDGQTSGREVFGEYGPRPRIEPRGDSGSAARFFYTAKADADDRIGSKHPTVKPVDLMQWLVRLVTPKGGLVLDPFAGTGTTAEAAFREGMRCALVEREAEYQDCIRRRMRLVLSGPDERRRESIKAKLRDQDIDLGPLFAN